MSKEDGEETREEVKEENRSKDEGRMSVSYSKEEGKSLIHMGSGGEGRVGPGEGGGQGQPGPGATAAAPAGSTHQGAADAPSNAGET